MRLGVDELSRAGARTFCPLVPSAQRHSMVELHRTGSRAAESIASSYGVAGQGGVDGCHSV